jgi:hypothetical protein
MSIIEIEKDLAMSLRLAITALCLLMSSAAIADTDFHVKHGHQRHRIAERFHHDDHRDRERRFAHRHRHEHRDFNSYSGEVAVYVRPNVGTWSYGGGSSVAIIQPYEPVLKIIDVKAAGNSACSMEAGVCVIRP